MTFNEIVEIIKNECDESIIDQTAQEDGLMPFAIVSKDNLLKLGQFLYENPKCYFDYLACVTGMDNGPGKDDGEGEKGTMEIIYNLYSIPFDSKFCFKVILHRNHVKQPMPEIESVSHIWRTANWHEREIFDLYGIHFANHPDLRRILLPADWEGFPLRKDYKLQEYYHEIKVEY
ncbi:MAG: NADH-quinone oxidoreductase subunit C [Cytophagales bacterium]